ncbi:hypothetical protein [Methylobacterium dankookense]|uniref:Uncharacterized protein n=1 Tax=Methylobacterium dankookense TaxID=560405 RepID=A0A564G585_9HYPH|nr:hypothetical protein [Methylobacterium dankookense]GJD58149.1 hypothetical protein IFDJLNFL_4064 [Methylobacterium dankookense]VUF15100.1 hypothetical protein MTDSW087_04833 [Methylobacterium dankookense]
MDEASLWQLAAAIDGYNRAQGAEEEPPELGFDEFDAMLERNAAFVAGER